MIINKTDKLILKTCPKFQRGVFAGKQYKKAHIIETCPLIRTGPIENPSSILHRYLFDPDYLSLGYGAMYNHSDTPNARVVIQEEKLLMKVYATRDILKNEQIFIHYGHEYWQNKIDEKI